MRKFNFQPQAFNFHATFQIYHSIFETFIAATIFFIILWAAWQTINQPDLGIVWTDQGIVIFAPQNSAFQKGDIIQEIDNVPLHESMFPYFIGKKGMF
ncbi:MAG: hypothetical protein M5U34_34315 [Chloroflexi bacterium]|nr:hypothetical protein [Chloroflexota bacterium]